MKYCCFINASENYKYVKKMTTKLNTYISHLLKDNDLCFLFQNDCLNRDCLQIVQEIKFLGEKQEKIKIINIDQLKCEKDLIDICDICFLYINKENPFSNKTIAYIKIIKNKGLLLYYIN